MAGDASTHDLIVWIERFHDLVREHQAELTELDSVIGDADHGSNLARGMDAVVAKVRADAPTTPADLFKTVGMTLVSTVGGASGPLYGTFFLRFGGSAGASESLDATALGAALRAGLDGVVARGKAAPGDKTMIDALTPAADAWDTAAEGGASPRDAAIAARDAAREGRDATIPLVARKGRASYLGERSAGHLDPGAASTTLLIEALSDALTTP
ncbi:MULTISPECIES: dihydroxyacetone kinase subunit DhaL [unclassified Microbacterium]|uniref:dihydroxyacetone kinase subunit DhaL n=1 Tax=unclassified Microbacterium TaxID=2609290 RepID=UPI000D578678|nr:dihydroxyacetone kinase subunit DhaL [Microbacterium sp. Gd 4-13]PVW04894.1 dihydroxyacetone kinase subunit L [Microbacterium sp. Gd 4-13]